MSYRVRWTDEIIDDLYTVFNIEKRKVLLTYGYLRGHKDEILEIVRKELMRQHPGDLSGLTVSRLDHKINKLAMAEPHNYWTFLDVDPENNTGDSQPPKDPPTPLPTLTSPPVPAPAVRTDPDVINWLRKLDVSSKEDKQLLMCLTDEVKALKDELAELRSRPAQVQVVQPVTTPGQQPKLQPVTNGQAEASLAKPNNLGTNEANFYNLYAGSRMVVVGGTPHPDKIARLKRLGVDVDWIDTGRSRSNNLNQIAVDRISPGKYDLVFVWTKVCSHALSSAIKDKVKTINKNAGTKLITYRESSVIHPEQVAKLFLINTN